MKFSRPVTVVVLVVVLVCTIGTAVRANTIFQSLRMESNARTAALGGNYSALVSGANSALWNPGGLGFQPNTSIQVSHQEEIFNLKRNSLAVSTPFGNGSGIGISSQLLYLDTERRTMSEDQGSFTAYEGSLGIYYGFLLGDKLGIGGGPKLLRQSLGNTLTEGIAFDAGLYYWTSTPIPLELGFSVRNFGPDVTVGGSSFELPATVSGGLRFYHRFESSEDPIVRDLGIYLEQVKNLVQSTGRTNVGLELGYRVATFRVGRYQVQSGTMDGGVTAGIGLDYQSVKFHYAYGPGNLLRDRHLLTMEYSL